MVSADWSTWQLSLNGPKKKSSFSEWFSFSLFLSFEDIKNNLNDDDWISSDDITVCCGSSQWWSVVVSDCGENCSRLIS